jgi:hypothetical protein
MFLSQNGPLALQDDIKNQSPWSPDAVGIVDTSGQVRASPFLKRLLARGQIASKYYIHRAHPLVHNSAD